MRVLKVALLHMTACGNDLASRLSFVAGVQAMSERLRMVDSTGAAYTAPRT